MFTHCSIAEAAARWWHESRYSRSQWLPDKVGNSKSVRHGSCCAQLL